MKPFHNLLYTLIILWCSGCAVTKSTAYQPKEFTGGFTETRLGEDIYSVRFQGNGYTREEKATDFCLLRCAELTKESGYTYFIIVENQEGLKTPATNVWPSTHNTIQLYKEKPKTDKTVYEAIFVIHSLKTKYKIKS